MEYRLLGKSPLAVSEIGFGCMSLHDDHQQSIALIHEAISRGINYFDTADIYQGGLNEEILGKAIRGKRDDVIIATKVGNVMKDDGSGFGWNPSRQHIISSVEKSLGRLGVSYIDLYQLHGGTIDDPIDETIDAFETLMQQGKIRYYGISSIRPNVIREWAARSNMVSVMMQYSLLDRRPEETVFDLLLEKEIGVLARGSIASGLLTGKQPMDYLGFSEDEVAKAAAAVAQVSNRERTPAQTAVRFVLDHPAVQSAVVGIRTKQQLEDILALPTTPELEEHELRILRRSVDVHQYTAHR